MRPSSLAIAAVLAGLGPIAVGCGDADAPNTATADGGATVVVTTNILGDVVENLVGDEFDVVTIMPVGADPHDFQPSAEQVAQIEEADVLIVNGAGFEEGLLDVIEAAESDGVPVFEAMSAITPLEFADEDHADEDHPDDEDEDEDDHDDHGHDGIDPHFFTDPSRMAQVATAAVDFLVANTDDIDEPALRAEAESYVGALESLDVEVASTLEVVPPERRVLVTNHEVFGYFADRYDFEVIGAVIPTGSTADGTSAEALVELADVIEYEQVPAIFTDTSSSDELAQTLAAEVGDVDVDVVELFTESLGAPGSGGLTYIEMVGTNAQRIAEALGS